MSILQVGSTVTLPVSRKIETGYVLTNGQDEVLLHISETVGELEVAQTAIVFLYHDKKGQLVATMQTPTVGFDSFDWAEVVEVVKGLGVFVNIGIQKEILVSNDNLPLLESVWPQVGDMLYIALAKDKKGRLTAEPVTEGEFANQWELAPETVNNRPISGRVIRTSREGAVLLTEEGYRGFIHHTERKREPRLGEWVKGRVIAVKEDGTLNVSLRPLKQESRIDDADMISSFLNENGGVMPLSDKSDPDEIFRTFRISKGAFKRALGKLMKEDKIEQIDEKIYLKHKSEA